MPKTKKFENERMVAIILLIAGIIWAIANACQGDSTIWIFDDFGAYWALVLPLGLAYGIRYVIPSLVGLVTLSISVLFSGLLGIMLAILVFGFGLLIIAMALPFIGFFRCPFVLYRCYQEAKEEQEQLERAENERRWLESLAEKTYAKASPERSYNQATNAFNTGNTYNASGRYNTANSASTAGAKKSGKLVLSIDEKGRYYMKEV